MILFYDKIDAFEQIDVSGYRNSHKCIICQFSNVLDANLKGHPKSCNYCHNLTMKDHDFQRSSDFFYYFTAKCGLT